MSNSVRPHRRQPTRLPRPWDSPGKNAGVGCHFLLQGMKVKSLSRVQLFETPRTAAYQAPPPVGFSRQEYWNGCHALLQRIFPTQGSNPLSLMSPESPADGFFTTSATSVQFSSVAQSCPTLCDPMNRSKPGLPVHQHLPEFTQTHAHRVSDAIQPSHPRSSPSPPSLNPAQHQSLFQ